MSAAVSYNHVNLIHRMCLLDLIHQHNPFPLHHHLAYGLTIGFHLCTMLPPTTERQDNSNSRALYLFPKIAPLFAPITVRFFQLAQEESPLEQQ